jgi:signal transduction histidine kinase
MGEFQKAYDYLSLNRTENDSVYSVQNARQLNAMHVKFESVAKEKQIEQKNSDLIIAEEIMVQQRNFRNTLLAFLILSLVTIVVVVRNRKFKIESNKMLRLKNEEIVRQNKEIQTLVSARSRWFVNIAHDLRSPLGLIKGPISQLINSENLDKNEMEIVGIAKKSTDLLESLVNEILDLSDLTHGGIKLNISEIDLYELVGDTFKLFETAAKKLGIEIKITSSLSEDDIRMLDKSKMQKVLINLISNAIKFSQKGGTITADLTANKNEYCISISDQGIGISVQDLPRIFDRFYQSKADNQESGFGVGLALSKEIVELHGGTLTVKSELGVGSQFLVQLPANGSNAQRK